MLVHIFCYQRGQGGHLFRGVLGTTHEWSDVFSCDGVYYVAPAAERRICVSRYIYIQKYIGRRCVDCPLQSLYARMSCRWLCVPAAVGDVHVQCIVEPLIGQFRHKLYVYWYVICETINTVVCGIISCTPGAFGVNIPPTGIRAGVGGLLGDRWRYRGARAGSFPSDFLQIPRDLHPVGSSLVWKHYDLTVAQCAVANTVFIEVLAYWYMVLISGLHNK